MPVWLLVPLEVLFLAAFVAGVALIYVPAAFIVGGLLGAVWVEMYSVARNKQKAGS